MNIKLIIKKHHLTETIHYTETITNQFSQDFSHLQNGRQASPDLAHLHDLHVVFLQLHVCVTLSIVKVSSTVYHRGTYSSSFPCSQFHSVTSGLCTFAMHSPHNQPPWIYGRLVCSVNPVYEMGSCLMLTRTYCLK